MLLFIKEKLLKILQKSAMFMEDYFQGVVHFKSKMLEINLELV